MIDYVGSQKIGRLLATMVFGDYVGEYILYQRTADFNRTIADQVAVNPWRLARRAQSAKPTKRPLPTTTTQQQQQDQEQDRRLPHHISA